jgi:choline dehydrogenase-like flavoprotein
MFHDARQLQAGTEIQADVCVGGAGAAGIAIARELIGQRQRVALLTSGGLEFARGPQKLYAGEHIGRPGFTPYRSRVRMYGGSTTRWTGHGRPLERLDFERRDWVPHSGWPFSRDQLEPYYRRAQEVCRLGPYDYELSAWSAHGRQPLPVEPHTLDLRIYQFGHPTDFGKIYKGELEAARNVDVWLHADVLEIEVDADARRVSGLRVATSPAHEARFVAARYVLACGGLENPRLLLASNRVAAAGLGNRNDLVGRFYTDHAFLFHGWFEPSRPDLDRTLNVIEDYEKVGSKQPAHAAIALPERTIRAEGLNDCAVYFVRRPNYKIQPTYFTQGVKSFIQLIDVLSGQDRADASIIRQLRDAAFGLPAVGSTVARQLIEMVRPRPLLALRTAIETTPNPESRVTLGEKRDALGVPRVRVDWRINASDQRGLHRLYEVLRPELARLGLGQLVEDPALDAEGWPVSMSSGMHHMGTTRMHDDPRQGVVDANCRVHDLANLYVAGSSVFPTGGVANPTLTIVALAIRLAGHLKQTTGGVGR